MNSEIQDIGIEKLELDPENPRLPESVERDQSSMLDHIAFTTSIEELMVAIGENGFFAGEPLIVVPSSADHGKFVVVEGNRRLTAVKLLNDPTNCSNPGLRIRDISNDAKYKPTKVPVVIRKSRPDVLPYLGFRHITGVKQWEPLAKARYIEQLFNNADPHKDIKDRYSEVARRIGSRRDHIKRNLDALAVYKVLKDKDFYEIKGLDDTSVKFAVLSTALADDRIGAFVGVTKKIFLDGKYEYESTNPIINFSVLNHHHIEEFTRWLYEQDKKGGTRIGESRNLRLFSAVVSNERALAALRGGSPLKIAFQYTSDLTKDFNELLYQAESTLKEAASMVATVKYEDDAYKVARNILENIKMIGRELKAKDRLEDDGF